jgi:hypothetical protein
VRITLDIDTEQLTDTDRRVLAALINGDAAPLVMPREMYRDLSQPGAPLVPAGHTPAASPAAPPSPTPAPPEFLAKLGEAVGQFAGTQHEARLPYAQQAGVRSRSTMDDDAGVTGDAADELENDQAIIASIAQEYREIRDESSGNVPDGVVVDPPPGPVDWEAHGKASPAEQRAIRAAHGLTPRLVQDPPVRHTTP